MKPYTRITLTHKITVLIAILALLAVPLVAFAAVKTDQQDYAPGSVVTISGDNSNDAGYVPGNSVDVAVSGPNGYGQSCQATVGGDGTWSCTVTLLDTDQAVGNYSYTASSRNANGDLISESGTFTDAININSFAANCSIASDSFTSGTTVCAKAAGLGNSASGKIEWWAPGAGSATRTTNFGPVNGNTTDTFAPTTCGTWTLKVYSPAGTFQDDDTFVVTGCDTTPPVVTISGFTPNGSNGWFKQGGTPATGTVSATDPSNVTAINCTDSLGGLTLGPLTGGGTTTASRTLSVNGEGIHNISCTATDGASPSNSGAGPGSSNTATVKIDTVAPTVSRNVAADSCSLAGNAGWCRGTQTAGFSASDATSGLADPTQASFTQSTTTNGSAVMIASGAVSDVAGNTNPGINAGPFKIDTVAPTISGSISPASPAASGWYNISTGAPTVSFTCGDTGGSGLASCTSPVTLGNGADQSVTGTATDGAGNSASANVEHVNVDLTAPSISAALDKSPAASGWFNISTGAPTVHFTCSDSGSSGLASCPADHTFGEGADQSWSGTASDNAGNSALASVEQVNVDLTAPSISVALDKSAAASGWFNISTGAPTVQFTCSDSGSSGLASCPANHTFGEGADQSWSGTASDNAGNSASASVEHVKVDLTAPSVTIVTPANNASYLLNQAVAASYSCSDSGSSDIESCAGPVADGTNIDTASVGAKSFTVNASDVAGNPNSATNNYSIAFKLCVLYDQTKSHKAGSTVPLKLQLCDVNGVNYSSSSIIVKATGWVKQDNTSSLYVEDSGNANPDSNFRYDATLGTTGGYIFNLSTKGMTSGTFKVSFTVDGVSNSSYYVKFDVK